MVHPLSFGFNNETAATNTFQQRQTAAVAGAPQAARAEFAQLVGALKSEGVSVCVVEDSIHPAKPDAVFPNNWVSFHENGTVVLYPLQSASRRPERRQDVVDKAVTELGFKVAHLLDLTHYEKQGHFLEGTGSLVLDHVERIAYACLSARTHAEVFTDWAHELDYEAVSFTAADRQGVPLYHTNVLMCIGERLAVVGTEAIAPADRAHVLGRLQAGGREILEIGHNELERFAGNMLELGTWDEALGTRACW